MVSNSRKPAPKFFNEPVETPESLDEEESLLVLDLLQGTEEGRRDTSCSNNSWGSVFFGVFSWLFSEGRESIELDWEFGVSVLWVDEDVVLSVMHSKPSKYLDYIKIY